MTFEQYLQEKYTELNQVIDEVLDNQDDFNNWFYELEFEEILKYAQDWHLGEVGREKMQIKNN